ncbi:MAG: NifB/NifX family molybdenum-iron cluster-binding protein [Anaerolineaceae bacterium]
MILLISVQQPQLESPIDDRFGRAPRFIQMDIVTNKWEAFSNPAVDQSKGDGMGIGAYESMRCLNIQPTMTDLRDIDVAAQVIIDGKLVDPTELLH